jgi:hypothetical protein
MIGWQQFRRETENRSVSLLQRELDRHRISRGTSFVPQRAIGQHGRTKSRIENRSDAWRDELQAVMVHRRIVETKAACGNGYILRTNGR